MTQPAPSKLVHDILRPTARPLEAFFAPRSVAVVGATETAGSVGRTVLAEPPCRSLQRNSFLPRQPLNDRPFSALQAASQDIVPPSP